MGRRLDELGIEHGGIKDAAYGSGVSFRDPDGIALEFFAPPIGSSACRTAPAADLPGAVPLPIRGQWPTRPHPGPPPLAHRADSPPGSTATPSRIVVPGRKRKVIVEYWPCLAEVSHDDPPVRSTGHAAATARPTRPTTRKLR